MARPSRLKGVGDSVVFTDGTQIRAAIITEIALGRGAHLKILAPRVAPYDELFVPHRADALVIDDRYWE